MTTDHQITDTARRVWASSGDAYAHFDQARKELDEGDTELHRVIDHHMEMPSVEMVRAQARRAIDVVSAAQAYYRDLRKLYVLAGGDLRPDEQQAEVPC